MEYETRVKLIRILADGVFHSGEQLGETLGISRAAVSKHIKVLMSWGLDIYRVQGKGYCLSQMLDFSMPTPCAYWHPSVQNWIYFLLSTLPIGT